MPKTYPRPAYRLRKRARIRWKQGTVVMILSIVPAALDWSLVFWPVFAIGVLLMLTGVTLNSLANERAAAGS